MLRALCACGIGLFMTTVTIALNETLFQRNPTVGKFCNTGTVGFDFGTLRSSLECGKECRMDQECFGFFFNKNDQSCRGSSLAYTDLAPCDAIPGVVYFAKVCPDPPPLVLNGNIMPGHTVQGAIRNYTCDPGYTLSGGSPTITCQDNGTWTSVEFQCLKVCANPPVVTNAVVSPGNNLEGEVKNYTCVQGYGVLPSASNTITCQADGTWTPVGFECILKTCAAEWHQIGDSCYYVEPIFQYMAFQAAKDYCMARQSYLVQLETQTEIDDVKLWLDIIFISNSWWVGITDEGTEGTWRWLESNAVATVLDWNDGEPDGGTVENYVIKWETIAWADVPADDSYTPLCERSTEVIV